MVSLVWVPFRTATTVVSWEMVDDPSDAEFREFVDWPLGNLLLEFVWPAIAAK